MTTRSIKETEGYVYVLISPRCEFVKIGGTDFAPLKRIKEINASEPYKNFAPWSLHDFRQVADWRKVEHNLHYTFRSKLDVSISGQKELFAISPVEASKHLEQIDESMILKKPKIDRMFQDQEFLMYLSKLFKYTAILNWTDFQGAWTFSLFPSTNGGRYYTLNIGSHEVAFSTLSRNNKNPVHMILTDRLINDFKDVIYWVEQKNGFVKNDAYLSGLYRSTSVFFEGNFFDAVEFLELKGVRRAIIAYWTEALIEMQERGRLSLYARNHNWNAVAELKKRILYNTV